MTNQWNNNDPLRKPHQNRRREGRSGELPWLMRVGLMSLCT